MKIRMLVQMPDGAARNGEPWPDKGETADLPAAEAAHLVASGIAEEVPEQDEAEQAPEPRRGRRKAPAEEEG
ncbi:hypothetical protein ACFOOM_07580 [Streptomyces echinoruber]|uniref:Uncharacterized protein n=1 Tax=Streptomyces echinoruber TaxID=68898 RepID=A0A918R1M3_9ACTN|nr:hypothetical protein [Streptomyces echinoruber]GGZ80257.1 hypothetical protein GCM10010389_17540 [Streptomyces echinoruber]